MGTWKAMVIIVAEGIWFRPGQAPKRLVLCKQNGRPEVVFGDDVLLDFEPHGYHLFLELPDDCRPFLCLGFHHSNTNCHALKCKTLFAKSGGVWRDEHSFESFVMAGVNPMMCSSVGLGRETCSPALTRETAMSICNHHTVGFEHVKTCLLYTSPSPRDQRGSRMPSSA